MYWEESECAWSFKPEFTKPISGFSQDPFRLVRKRIDPTTETSYNYWQHKGTVFGTFKIL